MTTTNHDCSTCGKDIVPLDPSISPVTLEGKTFYFCHSDNLFGCFDGVTVESKAHQPYPTVDHDELNCSRCLREKGKT